MARAHTHTHTQGLHIYHYSVSLHNFIITITQHIYCTKIIQKCVSIFRAGHAWLSLKATSYTCARTCAQSYVCMSDHIDSGETCFVTQHTACLTLRSRCVARPQKTTPLRFSCGGVRCEFNSEKWINHQLRLFYFYQQENQWHKAIRGQLLFAHRVFFGPFRYFL